MRLQISIDLLRLQGAIEKNGWVCIPPQLIKQANAQRFLNLTAYERKERGKYGDTHFIKPLLPKATFDAMTTEQREQIAICGNVRPMDAPNNEPTPAPTSWQNEQPDLDLPPF